MIWFKLDDRIETRWGIAYRVSDGVGAEYAIAGWYANERERDAVFAMYQSAGRTGSGGDIPLPIADLLCEAEGLLRGEAVGRSIEEVLRDLKHVCLDHHYKGERH